jgi:hypothetical protein
MSAPANGVGQTSMEVSIFWQETFQFCQISSVLGRVYSLGIRSRAQCRSFGCVHRAGNMLTGVYRQFTEGFETLDLGVARQVLKCLDCPVK